MESDDSDFGYFGWIRGSDDSDGSSGLDYEDGLGYYSSLSDDETQGSLPDVIYDSKGNIDCNCHRPLNTVVKTPHMTRLVVGVIRTSRYPILGSRGMFQRAATAAKGYLELYPSPAGSTPTSIAVLSILNTSTEPFPSIISKAFQQLANTNVDKIDMVIVGIDGLTTNVFNFEWLHGTFGTSTVQLIFIIPNWCEATEELFPTAINNIRYGEFPLSAFVSRLTRPHYDGYDELTDLFKSITNLKNDRALKLLRRLTRYRNTFRVAPNSENVYGIDEATRKEARLPLKPTFRSMAFVEDLIKSNPGIVGSPVNKVFYACGHSGCGVVLSSPRERCRHWRMEHRRKNPKGLSDSGAFCCKCSQDGCNEEFMSHMTAETHYTKAHGIPGASTATYESICRFWLCGFKDCKLKFSSYQKRETHYYEHTGVPGDSVGPKFECSNCAHVSITPDERRSHLFRDHIKQKPPYLDEWRIPGDPTIDN